MRVLAPILAVVLDVDGVIVDSPHEQAWRAALSGFADPALLTPALYLAAAAGRPRMDGALALLDRLGVPDAAARAAAYAMAKQARIVELIAAGRVAAFPAAVRLITAARASGLKLAAASSSLNANAMLARVQVAGGGSLLDAFDVNLSGHAVPHGKPAPDLFLAAAAALGLAPAACLVIEDAPAGIAAARAAGMAALGISRAGPPDDLYAAGADLVVATLDAVDVAALAAALLRPVTPPGTPPDARRA